MLVRLPRDVPTSDLTAEAYRGLQPDDGSPLIGPSEIRFAAQKLALGQDYEVRIQIPHGLVAATPPRPGRQGSTARSPPQQPSKRTGGRWTRWLWLFCWACCSWSYFAGVPVLAAAAA